MGFFTAGKHRTRQLNISGGIYGGRLLSVNQTHQATFMVANCYLSIKTHLAAFMAADCYLSIKTLIILLVEISPINKYSDGFLVVKRYLGKISSALNYIGSHREHFRWYWLMSQERKVIHKQYLAAFKAAYIYYYIALLAAGKKYFL